MDLLRKLMFSITKWYFQLDDKGELSAATIIEKAKTVFEDEEELKNLEEFTAVCATKGIM